MRDLMPFRERLLIFLGVYAFWAFAYLGVGALNASRPASVLAWDPVWYVPRMSIFIIPYLSAYVLPILLLSVPYSRRDLRRLAAVTIGMIVVCAGGFLLWPLTILRDPLAPSTLFDRLLLGQYAADRPTNLFPSLHVALSLFFALAVAKAAPRSRKAMLAWAALIAVSTLATRQHYLVDVIGGAAVAAAAWKIYLLRAGAPNENRT